MDNITQDEEIVKNMGKKCKWTAPNGQERECKPSLICGECEYNTLNKDKASGKDKASDYVYIHNYEYTKIQNYIEAIRLIAEKVGTAESDCIEQLARDVGNYLYDLVKGDKDND